jgi:threonine/homoserine/homoserine lactone efflux protein
MSRIMTTTTALIVVLALGALLTFGATRATASVREGPAFLRWMLVVFATYLALMALPVVVAF